MSRHFGQFMDEFFPENSSNISSHIRPQRNTSIPCLSPRGFDTSNFPKRPRVVHIKLSPPSGSKSSGSTSTPAREAVSYDSFPSIFGGNQLPSNTRQEVPIYRREYSVDESSDVKERGRLALVEEQKNMAFRENPNVFRKEEMLYINAIVNGEQMPLFIDTGAQASVMSLETCRNLGLEYEIDESQSGIASGVGFARIFGKLWRVPLQIGRHKFYVQFNILDMGVRLILGLDQMKRLGMSVDLRRGGCVVGKSFVPFVKPPNEKYLTGQSLSCSIM